MSNTGSTSLDIATRLVALRQWAGFSNQRDFAADVGLSQSEYNHYESGRRPLSLTAAKKIKARWAVTLDWLYFGDDTGMPVGMIRALKDRDYSAL